MIQKTRTLLQYWFGGIRIYVGLASALLTLEVWWWASTLFGGSQLETIRIQEVYAWLSVIFLTITLLVGPVTKLFPSIPGKRLLWDVRRALGLSAAWFATLHVLITYFKQFNGVNIFQLPATYRWSLLLGVTALVILLAMAATSVNAVMRRWGIWWFRLHRLIYVAVTLVLIHAFMVGAHAVTNGALISLSCLALLWVILNLAILIKAPEVKVTRVLSLSLCILVLAGALTFGLNEHFEQARAALQVQGHHHT